MSKMANQATDGIQTVVPMQLMSVKKLIHAFESDRDDQL